MRIADPVVRDNVNTSLSQNSEIISWLMAGDPAVRWQVMRDLLDQDIDSTKEEREKLAELLNKTLGNKELAHTPCYKEIFKTAQETFEPETVEKKEAQ